MLKTPRFNFRDEGSVVLNWLLCFKIVDDKRQLANEIIFSMFKNPKFDPSNDNNAAIRYSVYCEDMEAIKFLLNDDRVDPTVNSGELIRRVCQKGNMEILRLLLSHPRADLNVVSDVTIVSIAEKGNVDDIIEMLLTDYRFNNRRAIELTDYYWRVFKKDLRKKIETIKHKKEVVKNIQWHPMIQRKFSEELFESYVLYVKE